MVLDQVERDVGLLKDVLLKLVVLHLVEAELSLQRYDICLEIPDLVGGGVHCGVLDLSGADLLGAGHGVVFVLHGGDVDPLLSFNSVDSNRCMILNVVIVLAGILIINARIGLLKSGTLRLYHVVSEDVVGVAPCRHFIQPHALLHKRLPVGHRQLVPILNLAQAVLDAIPVSLAFKEDCMLVVGVLGFDGLLLGHVVGGVFNLYLLIIIILLR